MNSVRGLISGAAQRRLFSAEAPKKLSEKLTLKQRLSRHSTELMNILLSMMTLTFAFRVMRQKGELDDYKANAEKRIAHLEELAADKLKEEAENMKKPSQVAPVKGNVFL
uniref:Uncharacterized protein n=1 Tax=Palpitomonas bilix TaxID=652834 RepID=A0A7S3DFF1_9EUKA|mmetsp:Transcript_35201/g.91362  ORF Transcript_35201/g.91362 Transcript_35201/m.91362 type:complete len:110 (+) Transcript_35201:73-402(+)